MTQTNTPMLRVRNLVKEYRLYDRPLSSFQDLLTGGHRHRAHRVLDGVSLEVGAGEILGIIGRNGAGKSTLLRIICGVLDYDAGTIEVASPPAPVLELGLGFDSEQTGRENARFGALCLGVNAAQLAAKVDEIIEFSELGPIIDQPYRTYSTGQRMRLAFGAAMSVDSQFLVIDEALAVADILFQEKCIRRIKEVPANGGTVAFVSHSLQQVYELCSRAVLLEQGRVVAEGDPVKVGHEYELLMHRSRARSFMTDVKPHLGFGSGSARDDLKASLASVAIVDDHGEAVQTLEQGQRYAVRLVVHANADVGALSPGFRIALPTGVVVMGTSAWNLGKLPPARAGQRLVFDFRFVNRLATGDYLLNAGLAVADSEHATAAGLYVVIDTRANAASFSVVGAKAFYGMADLVDEIEIVMQEREPVCPDR